MLVFRRDQVERDPRGRSLDFEDPRESNSTRICFPLFPVRLGRERGPRAIGFRVLICEFAFVIPVMHMQRQKTTQRTQKLKMKDKKVEERRKKPFLHIILFSQRSTTVIKSKR